MTGIARTLGFKVDKSNPGSHERAKSLITVCGSLPSLQGHSEENVWFTPGGGGALLGRQRQVYAQAHPVNFKCLSHSRPYHFIQVSNWTWNLGLLAGSGITGTCCPLPPSCPAFYLRSLSCTDWRSCLPSPPATVLISFFSLLWCTFIYVCACRSFCSWFWGRVLCRSGWSETLNVNKADFRFREICLPPHTPPPRHLALQEFIAPCVSSIHRSQKSLITRNWGCKHLWAAHWVLGTEPGSSVRPVSAVNHWAIRPVSSESKWFFMTIYSLFWNETFLKIFWKYECPENEVLLTSPASSFSISKRYSKCESKNRFQPWVLFASVIQKDFFPFFNSEVPLWHSYH